jgi:hypothetical protein
MLAAVLLPSSCAGAEKSQDYCSSNQDKPECYCQAAAHSSEIKCLKFFGSNPGFSAEGAGTSATFDPSQRAPRPQKPSKATDRPSDYILFIHYGAPRDMTNLPDVSSLVNKFKEGGYFVRGADGQNDPSGTSAIDYFRQEDKATAQLIANSVNEWLVENGKKELATLKPRQQHVRNPPGYIGVWIFGRQAKQ